MQDGNFTEHEPQSNKFHRISLPSFLLLLKPIQYNFNQNGKQISVQI